MSLKNTRLRERKRIDSKLSIISFHTPPLYSLPRYGGKGSLMGKTIILTGKAVVSFRKIIEGVPDDEAQDLIDMSDLRESQIVEDDLLDIEWIHDDVGIEVRE
jgi:hypothetical protein